MESSFTETRERIDGVEYTFAKLKFKNGAFISVAKSGSERLGGISIAVNSGGRISSTAVIPLKDDLMLQKLLPELAAKELGGIVVVSLGVKDLSASEARGILEKMKTWLTV
jgi:hypothetical protein